MQAALAELQTLVIARVTRVVVQEAHKRPDGTVTHYYGFARPEKHEALKSNQTIWFKLASHRNIVYPGTDVHVGGALHRTGLHVRSSVQTTEGSAVVVTSEAPRVHDIVTDTGGLLPPNTRVRKVVGPDTTTQISQTSSQQSQTRYRVTLTASAARDGLRTMSFRAPPPQKGDLLFGPVETRENRHSFTWWCMDGRPVMELKKCLRTQLLKNPRRACMELRNTTNILCPDDYYVLVRLLLMNDVEALVRQLLPEEERMLHPCEKSKLNRRGFRISHHPVAFAFFTAMFVRDVDLYERFLATLERLNPDDWPFDELRKYPPELLRHYVSKCSKSSS